MNELLRHSLDFSLSPPSPPPLFLFPYRKIDEITSAEKVAFAGKKCKVETKFEVDQALTFMHNAIDNTFRIGNKQIIFDRNTTKLKVEELMSKGIGADFVAIANLCKSNQDLIFLGLTEKKTGELRILESYSREKKSFGEAKPYLIHSKEPSLLQNLSQPLYEGPFDWRKLKDPTIIRFNIPKHICKFTPTTNQ